MKMIVVSISSVNFLPNKEDYACKKDTSKKQCDKIHDSYLPTIIKKTGYFKIKPEYIFFNNQLLLVSKTGC